MKDFVHLFIFFLTYYSVLLVSTIWVKKYFALVATNLNKMAYLKNWDTIMIGVSLVMTDHCLSSHSLCSIRTYLRTEMMVQLVVWNREQREFRKRF